jgi:ribosomal protein S18 acetylase RimI-like enzyme
MATSSSTVQASQVTIRRWTREDLPAIQEVYLETWLDAYSAFIPESDLRAYFDEHYDLASLESLFEKPGSDGCVAEVNGRVVGFVRTIYAQNEQRFYVSSLYILPGCQGAGLGRRLMKEAEQIGEKYSADEIWLGVMTQNVKTVDWYRKLGFKFVREEPFTMGKTSVSHLIGFMKIPRPPIS